MSLVVGAEKALATDADSVPRKVPAVLMATSQMQRPDSGIRRDSFIGLDLMRGFAAFSVFFGHVRGSSFVSYGALPVAQKGAATAAAFAITRTGFEAVLVFFVLSGFLVGGQVIRLVQNKKFDIRIYAVDRATRILLPLIPACLITVAIGCGLFGRPLHLGQAVLNMVGLNGVLVDTLTYNAPLWSLAFEIWFYVLAGAVGYVFGRHRRPMIGLLVAAAGAMVFTILPARFAVFWFMGALCVFIPRCSRVWGFALGGMALCLVGALALQLNFKSVSYLDVTLLPEQVAEALFASGICLLIIFFCSPAVDSAIARLRKPALFMSSISYTLYVFHAPLDAALRPVFPKAADLSWDSIALFSMKVTLLLVVIMLFFLAFEAQTMRVRRVLKNALLIRQKEVDPVRRGG